jgi:hypothetical protein
VEIDVSGMIANSLLLHNLNITDCAANKDKSVSSEGVFDNHLLESRKLNEF